VQYLTETNIGLSLKGFFVFLLKFIVSLHGSSHIESRMRKSACYHKSNTAKGDSGVRQRCWASWTDLRHLCLS